MVFLAVLAVDALLDSVRADFAQRDAAPEAKVDAKRWYERNWNAGWGPHAVAFAAPTIPLGFDPVEWKRARVVEVARHYIGLPYRHHHVPGWNPTVELVGKERAGRGLDCSNFTSWVYNYGLGVQFTSDINLQSAGSKAPGRELRKDEPYAPGDLLFVRNLKDEKVTHVVIYIDPEHVIDSHGTGVAVRPFAGWYKNHLDHARRVIERP